MADVEIKRVPRIDVKKAGTLVGTRPAINLIEGSNVTLTVSDDSANNEVDVTIAASGSATPSDFQPAIVTGNYYYPPNMFLENGGDTLVADQLVAAPIWFSHTETWTRIGIEVATSEAAKSVRLGLYANGADNLPGALIEDFGTVSLATTGTKEITISRSLTANTVYWLASVNDSATAQAIPMRAYFFSSYLTTPVHALGMAESFGNSSGTYIGMPQVYRSFAFAALPDPFGTVTDGAFAGPAIWLRKV